MINTENSKMTKAQMRKQRLAEIEARIAQAIEIVRTGKCPQCSSDLRRNLALTGWWQCEQYGADGFRKDSTKPSCSFQTFTA